MLLIIEDLKFNSIYQYLLLVIISYYSYVNDTKTTLFRLIKTSKLNYKNIIKKYYYILISNRIIPIFINNYSKSELKNIFTKEENIIYDNYIMNNKSPQSQTNNNKYHSKFKNVLIHNFLLSKIQTNKHYEYLVKNFNIINNEYSLIIANNKFDNTPGIYTKINNLVNPNNWKKVIQPGVIQQFIDNNKQNKQYKTLNIILKKNTKW